MDNEVSSDGGASEEVKPDPRTGWPPELWPVVDRHGVELTGMCATIIGANQAIQAIQRSLTMGGLSASMRDNGMAGLRVLAQAQQAFVNNLIMTKAWTPEQVTECMTDVMRAKQLAQTPMPGAAGRIILAN